MCLVGNGDIYSIEQFNKLKESGICASFMVGRGALCKPWIFKELKEGKISDPSAEQRLEWLKNFAWYLLDYFGTDRIGVEHSREQFLENYVYLCRYVPTGLLAKEQLLNERNVNYKGRSELETLLGSQSPEDWVKVSEMLFGPVPSGFMY